MNWSFCIKAKNDDDMASVAHMCEQKHTENINYLKHWWHFH